MSQRLIPFIVSMQELALHIEYLLRRHDCVIVPGFGAFLRSAYDAEYSVLTVSPASADLCFNPSVENDDGMLANSFARRLSLPFEEARVRLYEETEALKQTLRDTGEVTLGRLGTFVVGEEGNLAFAPLHVASERMSTLGFPVIPVSLLEPASTYVNVEEMSHEERTFDCVRNYYIPVNKVFAKVAASLILVMAVGMSFWLTSGDTQNKDQYASVLPAAAIMKADKTVGSLADDRKLSCKQDTTAIPETGNEPVMENQLTGNSYLIVGTFRTTDEASRFIEQHPEQKLMAVSSGKLVRVSAASSFSREDLIDTMRNVDFRSRFADSWIWKAR